MREVRDGTVSPTLQRMGAGAACHRDYKQDEGNGKGRHPLHAERNGQRSPAGRRGENRRCPVTDSLCLEG